jgi:hypothetical protein
MEHVGQELVHLAANLSSISRANIEDKVFSLYVLYL